ncbi:MAG: zinc ribbon-containing protein [Woeseiaceae bacterium]
MDTDKLLKTYHTMLDHMKETALPTLSENIKRAAEKASELGEATKEEAEKLGEYIQRDFEDAGHYLSDYVAKNGPELENWIKDELEFAEGQFAEVFATLADKTRLELDALAERARQVGVWRTGEITHVGILYCKSCNEALHFKKPGHIPPCPKCRGTEFKKVFNKPK